MAAPRFDDIEGEDLPPATTAPRFEDIQGEDVTHEPTIGKGRAFALGASQGGTMGFADEIGGMAAELLPSGKTAQALAQGAAAATGIPWLSDLTGVPESSVKLGPAAMPSDADTPEQLQAKSDLIEGMAKAPTSYELVRNRMRAEAKQAKEQEGGAYMAGDVLGGIGASVAGNIVAPGGGAFLRGAAEGAVGGLGNSESDLLQGDVGGAAADTALGASIGGVSSYVGDKTLGRLLRGAPGAAQGTSEGLESMAEGRAVKAATGQNKAAIRQMIEKGELGLDTGTVERVGSDLLNEGVVDAGASARDILKRAGERKQAWGATINQALDYLDNLTPNGMQIDVGALADDMEQALVVPNLAGTHGQRQIAARMADNIAAFRQQGNSLSALEAFKRALDEDINYAKVDMPAASKAMLRMRTMLNNAIEDKADEVGRAAGASDVADLFKESKAVYSSMAIGERVAKNQVTANASNRLISPSDYGVGGAMAMGKAAASGNPLGAAALGMGVALGHRAIRTRGNQVAASAFRGLSGNALLKKVASTAPEYLGQFAGPIGAAIARGGGADDAALTATDYVLQQTNPEYRELKKQLAEGAE